MYEKLEMLNQLNKKVNAILQEIDSCNECLEQEYYDKRDLIIKQFLEKVNKLCLYGKEITSFSLLYYLDIQLDFYEKDLNLIFKIYNDGSFEFLTNPLGYGCKPIIYNSKTGNWTWRESESKNFIVYNHEKILKELQTIIEINFEKMMKKKLEQAMNTQNKLVEAISFMDKQ